MKHARQEPQITPNVVLDALKKRVGKANGITAMQLVIYLTDRVSAADERKLREAVVFLREQGHPVCATPGDGYFIAANDEELQETCDFLRGRALTSLRQENAMKRIALPELAGQLGLPVASADADATATEGENHESLAES